MWNSYLPLWSLDVKLYFARIIFRWFIFLLFWFLPSASADCQPFGWTLSFQLNLIGQLHQAAQSHYWKLAGWIADYWEACEVLNSWLIVSKKRLKVKRKWKLWNLRRLLTKRSPKIPNELCLSYSSLSAISVIAWQQ